MHTFTASHITQPQNIAFNSFSQSNTHGSASAEVLSLSQLKNEIFSKMQHIDELNIIYKEKSQTSFIKTFKKIMDSFSTQLTNAIQSYQNIDQQIEKDSKCVHLRKQTSFYKSQKQQMQFKLQTQLEKLREVKEKNQELKAKRNMLKNKSIDSQQKFSNYAEKNRKLSLQIDRLNNFSNSFQLKHKRMIHQNTLNQSGIHQIMASNSIKAHHESLKKATESTKVPTSATGTRIFNNRASIENSFTNKKFVQTPHHIDTQISRNKKRNISKSSQKIRKIYTSERQVRPFQNKSCNQQY